MEINHSILSFNGGETTYYLAHLTTLDKHASSALHLENFIPMPFGGLRKRPGTIVLAKLATATRLEAFNYSTTEQFILAFQSNQVVIYNSGGTTTDTIAGIFPDKFALQFAQINDVVFMADGLKHPRQLTRQSDIDWTLGEIDFKSPPLLDENDKEEFKLTTSFITNSGAPNWAAGNNYVVGFRVVSGGLVYVCNAPHLSTSVGANGPPGVGKYNEQIPIRVGRYWEQQNVQKELWTQVSIDAVSNVGAVVNVTSNFNYFTAGHIGQVIKISRKRALENYEVSINAVGSMDGKFSPALVVQGSWSFMTEGSWKGSFTIQISRDRGNTWIDHRKYTSEEPGDRNVAPTGGDEDERVLMRLKWDHLGGGSNTPKGILSAGGNFLSGLIKITGFTNAKAASAIALTPVEATTTEFWTEGAFSPLNGFPQAVGVHDSRLVFGGTDTYPLSLWLSRTNDLLDFTSTTDEDATDEDSGIFRTLSGRQQDRICWIASQKYLFTGTAGGEWVIGSEINDKPISPANFAAREHTNVGSVPLAAIKIGAAVYFIERQGRRLREFAFVYEADQYEAADLTRLAEHITEGGITQYAWQSSREPTLWGVRKDGVLLSFSYNRNERIAAWARHTIEGGLVRSVAVLRNETGDDEVVLVVQRGDDFYLEKIASGQQLIQELGNLDDAHFVDGGIIGETDGNLQVALPDFYEDGAQVYSLANGIFGKHVVSGGKITLSAPCEKAHVGFPIVSRWSPLPIDIAIETGSTHGMKKQGVELRLNVFRSWGCTVTYGGNTKDVIFTNSGDPLDAAPGMVTGWKEITLSSADLHDLTFEVSHSDPYPFTLRGVVLRWKLNER